MASAKKNALRFDGILFFTYITIFDWEGLYVIVSQLDAVDVAKLVSAPGSKIRPGEICVSWN